MMLLKWRERAKQHKIDTNASKSIVILYTDGEEYDSSSSRDNAKNAISKANAPEIDEVFLIYVGNSSSGKLDLEKIANETGRKFLEVNNASQLQDAIDSILKEQ